MDYRRLGRSDLEVSSIALGCVTFDREITPKASFDILDYAVERGINLLDTAEAYSDGKSETVVGKWLKRRGKHGQVLIATKAIPPLGRHLIDAAEASLRRLHADVIDLYQLHAWDSTTPLEETLEALNALIRQGKVRNIGCSNFLSWQLAKGLWTADANEWPRMVSVQPIYNVAVRHIETEVLPLCAEEEIGVITYSPLGAGFLTGKYYTVGVSPQGTRFDIKPGHWDVYKGATAMRRMEGLRALAEATGRSMADLALAWVTGQPGITSVLVGARSVVHIEQAFAAADRGLDPELRATICAL